MTEKNKAAVALGKRSAASFTPEQRKARSAEAAAKRWAALSPEQRSEQAKAQWARKKAAEGEKPD